MPLPKRIARANRRVLNPLMRHIAGRIPPLAIISHRGRRSGTLYHTPIMAFRAGNSFIVALTYGRDVDWLHNVLAAGTCTLQYRNRRYSLADPHVFERDPNTLPLPWLVRTILGWVKVTNFLRLRVGTDA
jgi:deazaflavin-dependent oxidoreductase (nitroreductase family)